MIRTVNLVIDSVELKKLLTDYIIKQGYTEPQQLTLRMEGTHYSLTSVNIVGVLSDTEY